MGGAVLGGRRRRVVPIIDPLRPTLERVTYGRGPEDRLIVGPKGGVITTATLRDATNWDQLVIDLGLDGLVRHGLRHTALTWMADSGVTSPCDCVDLVGLARFELATP